ncbi:2-succinyl-5-enolpyruvyl-6-hydroxy-3-cyclohexene-1-carboxylic-acid synthase [candidate division KSB1 bacterium]
MIIDREGLNSIWGSLIVEELLRNGVDYFCISPGSRSTPVTRAAAKNKQVESVIIYDERNASYHALGYARVTGRPAVVISTSGTAAANHYPAVIEASMDNLPMIVITADRPPELQSSGANQTIDQVNLYGKYVRWHYNLPCPDPLIKPETVLSVIDQMILKAAAGPVHLNCMFREPFINSREVIPKKYFVNLTGWKNSEEQYTTYREPLVIPHESDVRHAAKILNSTKKAVAVIGRIHPFIPKEPIINLINKLGIPVFADISSGLKNNTLKTNILYFDQLLNSKKFREHISPDVILHFGAALTSKRYAQFTKNLDLKHYIQVCDFPGRADPENVVSTRFYADYKYFSDKLTPLIKEKSPGRWAKDAIYYDKRCSEVIAKILQGERIITEPGIAWHVSRISGRSHALYIGNSMPIRDFDMFPYPDIKCRNIGVNRGTSGIDGNIASALGFSRISKKPLTLILGDIAFLHNLNALEMIKNLNTKIIIIVVNNHGGGIFSFLPVAKEKDIFEKFFGTPHNYKFSDIAEMFSLEYHNPDNMKSFTDIYSNLLKRSVSSIIEVNTDRSRNYKFHEKIKREVVSYIDKKG